MNSRPSDRSEASSAATHTTPAAIEPASAQTDTAWQALFNGKDLKGWGYVATNWKVDSGMIVGKAFVKDHFPAEAKQRYSDLVEAMRTVYREHIQALTWMSDATKQKALASFTVQKMTAAITDLLYRVAHS